MVINMKEGMMKKKNDGRWNDGRTNDGKHDENDV